MEYLPPLYVAGALAARAIVALVLVVAGVAKLILPHEFERTVSAFGLLPSRLSRVVARCLPLIEILLGGAMVLGRPRPLYGVAASSLFVLFSVVVTVRLLRDPRT